MIRFRRLTWEELLSCQQKSGLSSRIYLPTSPASQDLLPVNDTIEYVEMAILQSDGNKKKKTKQSTETWHGFQEPLAVTSRGKLLHETGNVHDVKKYGMTKNYRKKIANHLSKQRGPWHNEA